MHTNKNTFTYNYIWATENNNLILNDENEIDLEGSRVISDCIDIW